MKKMMFLMLTFLFWGSASMNAQVTIGSENDPNPSAVLDLQTSNQGLLLPRVALISTTSYVPLKAHVAGMTVYNVAVSGSGATAVIPGLYTNDGSKWIRMAEGASVAVAGAPVITTQPAAFSFSRLNDANGDPTGPASFSTTLSVTATGDAPLKYQWYKKSKNTNDAGTAISGAMNASYDVDITASGIANWGMYSYYCVVSNAKGSVISEIAVIALGCGAKTIYGNWLSFMCYNLGADPNKSIEEQMAYATTSNTDATVLGDLYQWGRNTDGHEKRTSDVTTTLASNIQATAPAEVTGKFIARDPKGTWTSASSDRLWANDKTTNDPCPTGWHVIRYQDIYDLGPANHAYLNLGKFEGNEWSWNSVGTPGMKMSTQGIVTLFWPANSDRSWMTGVLTGLPYTKLNYWYAEQSSNLQWGFFASPSGAARLWSSDTQTTSGRGVRCVPE